MKVWILQTGEPLHMDAASRRPMRAINLSNVLSAAGHEVTIWSSDFDHFSKSHRIGHSSTVQVSNRIKIRLIHSLGYKTNVGLARLIDHAQLAWNLRRALREADLPDVAFIGYPPIEAAWVMTRWLKDKSVPTVLDVKDAWPDVLLRAFPTQIQPLARVALSPYFRMMKSTFRDSNSIASISQPFLEWALNISERGQSNLDFVAPLTAPQTKYTEEQIAEASEWWDLKGINEGKIFRAYFVGTLNSAFNFDSVIAAAENNAEIDIVIAGNGTQFHQLETRTESIKNLHLVGWISAVQATVLARRSHASLAPVRDLEDFRLTIPNKFYDAFAAGKPIVSSIKGFAAELIQNEEVGLIYDDTTLESLGTKLQYLKENPELLQNLSLNARKIYDQRYSFERNYNRIGSYLELVRETRKNG